MDENLEEKIEDLYSETGFEFQAEVETLEAMLTIAKNCYNGYMPGLDEWREAAKISVIELCTFFIKYVDCL